MFGWFKEINQKLDIIILDVLDIKQGVLEMTETLTQLDTEVGNVTEIVNTVGAAQAQISADIAALAAKISTASSPADFSNEVASLQASEASLKSAVANLTASDLTAQSALNPVASSPVSGTQALAGNLPAGTLVIQASGGPAVTAGSLAPSQEVTVQ
jgi:hypothetical protein